MLITVLVRGDSDVGLEDEFENIKQWARDNTRSSATAEGQRVSYTRLSRPTH